jgi:hypothetical protein
VIAAVLASSSLSVERAFRVKAWIFSRGEGMENYTTSDRYFFASCSE